MEEEVQEKKYFLKEIKALKRKVHRLEKAKQNLNSYITIRKHLPKKGLTPHSEVKYHNIFNMVLDGLYVTTPKGEILDINKHGLEMFGYNSKEEAFKLELEKDIYVNPSDRQRILSMVNSQGSAEYEVELKKKDGEIVFTHSSMVAVKDNSGKISSYIGIVRDISKQKQSEKALYQLNRKLRAISKCNQTLLRTVDEHSLLNEICRIICDEAGYRLAWVGYAEQDEAKTVRPVAWAGSDNGYIENAKLTWADSTERGLGPTGKAVRSGEITYVQDFMTDPQMAPWRESAIQHGLRSSIVLPLKDETTKVFGVLQIYSTQSTAFTQDEIRLLEELASDLAFGITVIRNRIEYKRMTEEVRNSEERFRMIFENVLDGISIFSEDPDPLKRKLIDCNEQYAALAGRSCKELLHLGNMQGLFVKLEERKSIVQLGSKETGTAFQGSFSWIRPDGKENIIEYVAKPIMWRGELYSIGIDREITERIQAENKIRKLSRAVEQSPVSIVITDTNGDIEYVNPKVMEITGYQFEELIGKNPRIFSSGEQSKNDYKVLWDTILSGKEWSGELHNKKKNGALYWESVSISPILSENGDITHFIAIKEDITGHKKILEELILAKEKAEQSDKLKSEFLSQVSHEIRTPLVSMVNYSDMIRDDIEEGNFDGLSEYIGSLSDAGKRLQRTFDLIINAAQILTNNFEPTFIPVDLVKDILLQVYNEFKNQADQKGLDYIFVDNSKDKNIIADEYSVSQLFSNLLDNAIKYTKEGFVKIEVAHERETVIVNVIDSGIGISSDFLTHLFEPFRQEEQGYTRKYEGNGLGLLLAKKYCEINNAEINVDSIQSKGSTFTVRFKLQHETGKN